MEKTTNAKLKEILVLLGKPTTGKKVDLIERIKSTVCGADDEPEPKPVKDKKPKKEEEPKKEKPKHVDRYYIHVEYDEKDAAKSKGARWDPDRKLWWVPDTEENREEWPSADFIQCARLYAKKVNEFLVKNHKSIARVNKTQGSLMAEEVLMDHYSDNAVEALKQSCNLTEQEKNLIIHKVNKGIVHGPKGKGNIAPTTIKQIKDKKTLYHYSCYIAYKYLRSIFGF